MSTPGTDFTNKPITPSVMREVLSLPDAEAEQILFNRIQNIVAGWELTYGECGLICRNVEACLLYEQRIDPETGKPCSFSRWVRVAAPRSYSTVYAAMRDVAQLKDIPDEEVARIRASNFPIMVQLSSAVRSDPDVLRVAQTERSDDLLEHVRQHHPDQHVEHRELLRFHPEKSAAETIRKALKFAQLKGAANMDQALELIAVTAIETWEYEEAIEQAMLELKEEES